MRSIRKKLVVDEEGNPQEVIIAWKDFQEIEQSLGLDLDEDAVRDLRRARRDRTGGQRDAYVALSDL